MARGWESKSIEQQQADLLEKGKPRRRPLSAAQQEVNRKWEGLRLSRARLASQLGSATHDAHRRMLKQALAEIDRQIGLLAQDVEEG